MSINSHPEVRAGFGDGPVQKTWVMTFGIPDPAYQRPCEEFGGFVMTPRG